MTLPTVFLRGGGDLATGVAWRLVKSGFAVAILETPHPLVIRRNVSFANAVFEGAWTVEGIRAVHVRALPLRPWMDVPVLVDPHATILRRIRPDVLVDARMTKNPIDIRLDDAPLVIGLGPGFEVGTNCHRAVETQRGHFLGRVYETGGPIPDTGVPGTLGGETQKRIVRAPADGMFEASVRLGMRVGCGDAIGRVDGVEVLSELSGTVRGLIHDGTPVPRGLKIADVDPRHPGEFELNTISDKARAIGGGVLEAILGARAEGLRNVPPLQLRYAIGA